MNRLIKSHKIINILCIFSSKPQLFCKVYLQKNIYRVCTHIYKYTVREVACAFSVSWGLQIWQHNQSEKAKVGIKYRTIVPNTFPKPNTDTLLFVSELICSFVGKIMNTSIQELDVLTRCLVRFLPFLTWSLAADLNHSFAWFRVPFFPRCSHLLSAFV